MGNTCWCVCACAILAIGCSAGDTRIDPADLELRDLLGVAPEVAVRWDAAQRASARRVIADGLRDHGEPRTLLLLAGDGGDDRVIRTLDSLDAARAAGGEHALGLVRLTLAADAMTAVIRDGETAAQLARDGATSGVALDGWAAHAWGYLPGRGLPVLAALARDAGHDAGPVIVAPAARLPAIAGYIAGDAPRLVVNPIVLAALEPAADEAVAQGKLAAPTPVASLPAVASLGPAANAPHAAPVTTADDPTGNPYSFYGSVAECAFAQRARCEACVTTGTCQPVTDTSDGAGECTKLGEQDGRGYYLLCVNLALAIHSVADCAAAGAPSCARSVSASTSLATLKANADFLDDPACGAPLDTCLADIYGASPGEFPGVDGGTTSPVPPRSTAINCQDSCSSSNSSNNTCTGPSVDCTGPSCNNSLSCDSACSSSNDQSGCGGDCSSCNSSGGDGNSGCSSNDSSGGGCGGSSGCGNGCGNDKCSSGGGNGCSVARPGGSPRAALVISILWATLPVPAAAVMRRRRRRVPPRGAREDAR